MEERHEYLLDQFFSKRLTPAEKTEMDLLLSKDPTFADTLAFEQKVAAAVISNERVQLKAILQKEEQKTSNNGFDWGIWTNKLWSMAAAIAVIAVAIWAIQPYWNSNAGSYTQHDIKFTRYANEFASAGGGQENATLQQASAAYQNGQWAEAAQLFGQITPPNPSYAFYQGVAQVGAGKYAEAIAVLQPLVTGHNPDYATPAQYYMALAYYLSGDKKQAQTAAAAYLATAQQLGDETMRAQAALMAQ